MRTITHRPEPTRHGMHCTCGVYCGHDWMTWHNHHKDAVLLHPDHTFNPAPETQWDRLRTTFEVFASAMKRITAPRRDNMTRVDGV